MDYSSCEIEICNITPAIRRAFKNTLSVYQSACACISEIAEKEWGQISLAGGTQKQLSFVERLIHSTKNNKAPFPEFDEGFYKFPSYYRRSAINFVLGQLSSFKTRLAEYEAERYEHISNGKKFQKKCPKVNHNANICPTLYNGLFEMDGSKVRIKVFTRNTWDWVEVKVSSRDFKYLETRLSLGAELGSPKLIYKFHKFYLSFPLTWPYAKFPNTHLDEQKVLSVDLGINRGATVSVIDHTGTVHGRFFDPFTKERDRINHMIDRIRKVQRESGLGNPLAKIYTKLDGLKQNYVKKLSNWIVKIARENGVYGIVLEHLGRMKAGKSRSARIHHWCKCRIRDFVKGMALRFQIRVFQVNPKNTSKLAFDGSGEVTRNNENFTLCTFASGKQYNCDLSASYNIGARYFLRARQKTMPEEKWSELTAKVPELQKRTDCTLSTLWKLEALRKSAA